MIHALLHAFNGLSSFKKSGLEELPLGGCYSLEPAPMVPAMDEYRGIFAYLGYDLNPAQASAATAGCHQAARSSDLQA
jgi:hypothetical protein